MMDAQPNVPSSTSEGNFNSLVSVEAKAAQVKLPDYTNPTRFGRWLLRVVRHPDTSHAPLSIPFAQKVARSRAEIASHVEDFMDDKVPEEDINRYLRSVVVFQMQQSTPLN
jgi:hypothetical protein